MLQRHLRRLALAVPCAALLALPGGCARTKESGGDTLLSRARRAGGETAERDVKPVKADDAPFVAARKGRVYHTRYCQFAGTLDSPVGYARSTDAARLGLIPCEFCNPADPANAPKAGVDPYARKTEPPPERTPDEKPGAPGAPVIEIEEDPPLR